MAATVTVDGSGICTGCAIALTGVGPTPVVPRDAARALVGVKPTADAFADVGGRVARALVPDSDLHASADYRKHLAGVLTRRALARAAERVSGPVGPKERR